VQGIYAVRGVGAGISFVEIFDQFWGMEVVLVYPGIMRWRVAFPPHQILLLSSSAEGAFFEYPFNFPFWFTFYDVWWWL